MASITFQHVQKTYPGMKKSVIKDLNLEIKDKEFIILVGPSGCGKSTTLRMIAGLEDISKGNLLIDGKKMNDVSPKDRDIAMVFQNYALYPNMTVYKNIAFPLKIRKLTPKEIAARVELAKVYCKDKNLPAAEAAEYIDTVKKQTKYTKEEIDSKVHAVAKVLDLEAFLDRKPANLSGGQRQRVALGRAMVRSPKVFLLDEPLSNLDAKLRTEMRSQISQLHKKLDTTFVYVTHDQTEAMTIADRIAVLNNGDLQQFDTPRNLYESPCNMFVAGFIGSPEMNFIKVHLAVSDNKTEITFANHTMTLDPSVNSSHLLDKYNGKDIMMGIRPEAITLATPENKAGVAEDAIVDVHIKMAEFLGAEIYFYFDLDGVQHIARIPSSYQVHSDMDAKIVIDSRRCYFFDPETQETLVYSLQSKSVPVKF
jgi:multiple sugar transport system ATP-binding protein